MFPYWKRKDLKSVSCLYLVNVDPTFTSNSPLLLLKTEPHHPSHPTHRLFRNDHYPINTIRDTTHFPWDSFPFVY